jgi:Family of unknown function (DUF5706)
VTGDERSTDEEPARLDFVQRALASGADWARFADPKLLGVFVFLGLGVTDLVQYAQRLWDAHDRHSAAGWLATVSFLAAAALAVLTVTCATFGLFPRVTPAGRRRSLFFFGGIATFGSAREYGEAVRACSRGDLETELLDQAWEIARVARHKLEWARKAYLAVVAFLAAWAVARIALSFAS